MNQKSVFYTGDEYQCQDFFDFENNLSGIDISLNNKHIGKIVGLTIPDIDDEDENVNFDDTVIKWIELLKLGYIK